MAEYYGYLLRTSWPSVVALVILAVFVLARLIWKGQNTWKKGRTPGDLLLFSGRMAVWIAVLLVYLFIFFADHPDWFYKPFFFEGFLEEKTYNQANSKYEIAINRSGQRITLTVDRTLYGSLAAGDKIKVMYLPIRREVVGCDVLESGKEDGK